MGNGVSIESAAQDRGLARGQQFVGVSQRVPRLRSIACMPTVLTVGGLTLMGLALRLLITRSLWIDEATSVRQAREPFAEMLRDLSNGDIHPPLHHIVLWVDLRLFGTSELAVRMPSIILGTLLIPLMYLVGRDLYDRRTGLTVAALSVLAPQAVWYSQEARMYIFFMVLATLALWAQIRAIQTGRIGYWGLFTLSSAAMLWSHYFAVLPMLVQQLAFLATLARRKEQGRPARRLLIGWITSCLGIILLLMPLAPYLHDQLTIYQRKQSQISLPSQVGTSVTSNQTNLSIYTGITNGIWALWGYHADRTMAQIVALWPLSLLLVLLLLGRGRSRSPTTGLLLALILLPAGTVFGVAFFRRDLLVGQQLFELRYFVGAIPVLLLLVARSVTVWVPSRIGSHVLKGVVIASLLIGLIDQQLNRSNPRLYDFRGALKEISRTAEPGDILLYQPMHLGTIISYYAPEIQSHALQKGIPRTGGKHRRVFLLASLNFASSAYDTAKTNEALGKLRKRRILVEERQFPNVSVWEFK